MESPADSITAAAPQLAYAPRGRWRWRLSRRYVIAGVLAALALVAWRWGGDVRQVAQTAYWARACMNYAPPEDLVVFEQDAAEIATLLASGKGYLVSRAGEADPPYAWHSPPQYAHIPQSGWAPNLAFMHGLSSAGGAERLVVVEILPLRHPARDAHTVFFHPRVFDGSLLRPGKELRRNEETVRIHLAPDERLRLYAGRADPRDPSRFTIDCVIAGERGTVEGQLRGDDVVTFRPIAGETLKRRWRTWDRRTTWWDPNAHRPGTSGDVDM